MRRIALVLTLASASVPLAGCESTVDQANKLSRQGVSAFKARGLNLTRAGKGVRVLSTAVVHDANGGAAVVTLVNTGRAALVNLPISINVRDRAGHSVYRNSDPGLEPALVRQPVLLPGRAVTWVNDQVQSSGGAPATVRVVPGTAQPRAGKLPVVSAGAPKLSGDPSSGIEARGTVTNRSGVLQLRLPVTAVARRAGKIVAAGTGVVQKLKPRGHGTYTIFFIGNPRGARLSVATAPVSFG